MSLTEVQEKAVFFYRGLKGFESIAPLRFALSLNKGESTGECVHASNRFLARLVSMAKPG
jgi:hypothetical protein